MSTQQLATCECLNEVSERLIQEIGTQLTDEERNTLKGEFESQCLTVTERKIVSLAGMRFSFKYKKKVNGQWPLSYRRETVKVAATFCPFCGTKLQQPTENITHIGGPRHESINQPNIQRQV